MKHIESAQNNQLKQLGKLLSQSKERRNTGLCVLEGIHLLQACLAAGQMPIHVFIPQNRLTHPEIQALISTLPTSCCTSVAPTLLGRIGSLKDADEVMTLIHIPKTNEFSENSRWHEDCVVLDRVQDPGNIGTVLRSAAASGVQNIVLGEGCADAYSPKVLRAAMGAHFLLNIQERVDLQDWQRHYTGRVLATALHENNNFSLYDVDLADTTAWIFGNEGSGVDEALLRTADATIRIPMLGQTESLNIAMAATICLFEQMRQRLK